ncbi:MAG TPA: Uma2 family endonuclease [Thermomicrobiales bacterium]|jgi:Uma2 family endonuclease
MPEGPAPALTPEEYLDLERASAEKHEYIEGKLVPVTGLSFQHNLIQFNLIANLKPQLPRTGCHGFGGALRVKSGAEPIYSYPDLAIVCGEPAVGTDGADTLLNPILLLEIMSPATEDYDRGEKLAHYRRIPTLEEYVLVAQESPLIEHHVRQGDGTWRWSAIAGLDETITLPTIGCTLLLADVYDGIPFATAAETE